VPLGLGVGIYLAEYASPRVRRIFKPVIEILAGVPTIVFGYFALTFFTPNVLQDRLGIGVDIFNGLSAGIVLGILVLPTIASVSEDALSAVPQSLREGAFGLGAAKWQVVMRVVFPAALSGIVAALVLGASRAIGETVVILVAAGNNPNLTFDLTVAHQNMAAFVANTARADVSAGSVAFEIIFAVGATLFVMTFLLNLVAIRFVRRYRQVYE
jgi:phosphate transport system permease protein